MRLILPVGLIFITTLLSGCIHVPKVPSVTQPPTAVPTATTPTIDTSDWQTYTNEEYGFSFRYPGEWNFFRYTSSSPIAYQGRQIEDPTVYISVGPRYNAQRLVVGITDFTKSPTESIDLNYLGGDDPRILLSKKEITGLKNTAKFIREGLYEGVTSIYYDYSGGGFILRKEMIVGNNPTQFSMGLEVDDFENRFIGANGNLDTEAVKNKEQSLTAGVGTAREVNQIEFFKAIVATITLLNYL